MTLRGEVATLTVVGGAGPGDVARCLDEGEALDLADGALGAPRHDELTRHLAACTACRRLVSQLSREARTRDEAPLESVVAGRYALVRVLGEGAMGVVYEAFDTELERHVALKLLKGPEGADGPGRQARLRREAQAMARVSHPNVVPVYDVGAWQWRLFLTM